jgi:predicted lipopolysaccharide heptosyltransferase III
MRCSSPPHATENRHFLSLAANRDYNHRALNILLIQLKRIGDLILTTPAIAALREKFPDANMTLVTSREGAALLPAIPGIDQTLIMRRNLTDAGGFFSVARKQFDYCIDFTRNDRSAFLALLSHAKKRIVSYRVKRRSKVRRGAYNEFVQHRMRDMHTIDYNLSLLEPLGIQDATPPIALNLPETARVKAEALLRHANIQKPYVLFHPGSARTEKFWEPDRWAEVISHATQRKISAVLTGGSSAQEKAHLAAIEAKLPRPVGNAGPSVVDLSGKMDLLTLGALIAQARLVVTVDTASMHLAAATRTPQVVLFGPTNPFHWYPREAPALILQGESPLPVREFVPKQTRLPMKLISTRAVIDAMDSLLSTPTS